MIRSRTISAVLSISLLLPGCFSPLSVTRDELAPVDRTVFFILNDGTHIRSAAGHHQRIEGGYQVSGDRWKEKEMLGTFDGIIRDFEIQGMSVYRFAGGRTVLAIGIAGGIVAICIAILWINPHDNHLF